MSNDVEARPKLGISSCLLGNEVRYDGGHKRNRYITRTLGEYFDFVPFCPEVAIGLSTPRPPIRLVDDGESVRVLGTEDSSLDYTDKLSGYGDRVSGSMDDYCGYIVKKDSPSCGMERVKIYQEKKEAPPVRRGSGAYTAALMASRPELPVEEEGRLMDPGLRENFVIRVFTLFRWRCMVKEGLTPGSLVEFHTRHKFLIQAHHEATFRQLGTMVARAGSEDLDALTPEYLVCLMQGLRHVTTPGKQANVLMHIMGFIKNQMTPEDKTEMLDLIEMHQSGLVPVIVPITLMNHFLRRYPHEYIEKQYFLEPHPRELMLRNHI